MKRIDLGDLGAFVVVAEERSFTRAAARLGVSQPSLSQTIGKLEARLGVRLLTRTTRSVSVTEAGERFLKGLRPALDEVDDQIAAIGELREKPSGTVRITAGPHAARSVIMP